MRVGRASGSRLRNAFQKISHTAKTTIQRTKKTVKGLPKKIKNIFLRKKDTYSSYKADHKSREFVGSKDRINAKNFATQRLQGLSAKELHSGKDTVYTVKKCDTLSEIAAKHGMDWRELAKYNKLDNPHLILPGQKIQIPTKTNLHTAPTGPYLQTETNTAAQSASSVKPLTIRNGSTTERLLRSVVEVAKRNNWNPEDLLTVMSYETAGTLNPWKRGPRTKWGRHYGLIQWGEPQRRRYGVYRGMPVEKQVEAVERYLKDHGVRRGDSILQIYAAINAGNARKIYASDAKNGGAPGTVLDKVRHQMHGHRRKARKLLARYGY